MLDDILFDLVRLLPDEERAAVMEGATMRRRALAVATRLGIRPSSERVRAAAVAFRRARDIARADELSAWCADRGMSAADFARLMTEEATLDALGGSEGGLGAQEIADFLRVVDGAEHTWGVARELHAQGSLEPSPRDDGHTLRGWYESELGRSLPSDVDRDARRRGFERGSELAAAIRRSARWSAPIEAMELGVGDPVPPWRFAHPTLGEVSAELFAGRWWILAWNTPDATLEALCQECARASVADGLVGVAAPGSAPRGSPPEAPFAWLVDPSARVAAALDPGASDASGRIGAAIARWSARAERTGSTAPMLVVPYALEPDFCAALVEAWRAGSQETGALSVLMDDGGEAITDRDIKRRVDHVVRDAGLLASIKARLSRRVFPEVKRAFQFEVTRCEGFRIGCYSAEDGGMFLPHRDDSNPATAHRRFALSVNLSHGAYEGGALRLPEYGATFDAPTGAALVYSASLLHEVIPVTRGARFALVGFFSGPSR